MNNPAIIVPPERAERARPYQPPALSPTDSGAIMSIIERAATAPDFNIEKIQQLLALKERWDENEARKAFTVAMAAFKADPPKIVKNKHVGFTNNKGGRTEYDHATHSEVTEKIAAGLGAHGLSHRWNVEQIDGGRIRVTCIITHSMGHSESVAMTASPDDSGSKNAIQALGSAVTYLQRYTLLASTGLTTADMDKDDTDGRGQSDDARPELPADVINSLKDAAKEGSEALAKAFKALSDKTRAIIVLHYGEQWSALKSDAAAVQS